jgi:hypothetical protein
MGVRVGKAIVVGDVISRSVTMITQTPALMFPQIIILILALIGDLLSGSALSYLGVIVSIVSFVASVIVAGAYPSMVQAVLGGGQFSVTDSLRKAYGRFWTLLIAGILVGLVVIVGFVALIVPGIIFVTWYAYTVPPIMLEEKGAMAGMAASKAFGRDKKWSTFLILLVIAVVALVILGIQTALSLAVPLLGRVVYSLLSVPFDAWIAVIFTYAYLTYGPSSVPVTAETSGYGAVPPVSIQQPMIQAGAQVGTSPPNNFCRSCGSPLRSDSKFCSVCGKAL